jgi:iduronate 2-sulfatase
MRWRVCVVLIATACAAPEGTPSDEPTDISPQHHREREEKLPAARPAEQQAAQQENTGEAVACFDNYWCAKGEGPPGERRPPKEVAASQPGAPKAPKGAKNVLLIIVDDMRPQLNKAYGHPYMITPAHDKLAQSPGAVVFSRAYAQAGHCAPSRNSFMSGRYPDRLKVWNVYSDFRAASNAEDPITPIPEHFKNHGYLSFGGGKVYHPNHPMNNDKPSWSEGTVKAGTFKYFNDHDHGCPDGTGGNPNVHGEGAHEGGCSGCPEDKPDEEFYDGKLANWTITALRHAHEDRLYGEKKPFFIATGFRRPHTPWNVAQRFVDMYKDMDDQPKHRYYAKGAPYCAFACGGDGVGCDFGITRPRDLEATKECRRTYYATVTGADFYIGQVLDELDNLKMAQDTAVALFGDHGWSLGENGMWAKYTNTELSTRVPLIIRAPWLASSQTDQLKLLQKQPNTDGVTHSGAFVELVDIYPTLVELAGLPQPKGLEGRSIVPVLERPHSWDGQTGPHNRDYAQSQFAHCCSRGEPDANRQCGACNHNHPDRISYMGYALRNSLYRLVTWYRWDGGAGLPHCDGLMAVELYNHAGDNGMERASFDDFEASNLAANLTIGAQLTPAEEEMANMMRREMQEENMGEMMERMEMGERLRVSGNMTASGNGHLGGLKSRGDGDERAYQQWRSNTNRPHSSAIQYMHHDLLQRFSTAFSRCVPSVAVQQHRRKTWTHAHKSQNGDGAQAEQQAIEPSLNDIHSQPGDWPDDTSCPDPE